MRRHKPTYNWITPEVIEHAIKFSLHDLYKLQIPRDTGFVYLMWAEKTNFFKIGYSENPERRQSEINRAATKMPFQVSLLAQWYTPTMRLSETYLHEVFSCHRQEGEWFSLSVESLAALGEFNAAYAIAASLYRQLLNHAHVHTSIDINQAFKDYPQFKPDVLGAKSMGIVEDILQESLLVKGIWFWEQNESFAQTELAAQIEKTWENRAA